MFKKSIANKNPFLSEYFESILNMDNCRIPNSILFYGQDIPLQYEIAVEIARILNCKGNKSEDCTCYSCNWLKENKHPSVLTVTNIDFKPSNDDTKNVISIKQAQMVKSMLLNASDNFRVFIFCGAEVVNDIWSPKSLNQDNFKAEAANCLLKIVEEAPENTLFCFLANDIDDIISTIVSRSQAFFVPSSNNVALTFSGVADLFTDYPNFYPEKLFDYSANFQKKMSDLDNIFDKCQNYLLSLLKSNHVDNYLRKYIINDIEIFEQAKKKYKLGIKEETVSDDLFLALMRK